MISGAFFTPLPVAVDLHQQEPGRIVIYLSLEGVQPMSWTCKYDQNGYCDRLRKPCIPTRQGCVLAGRLVRAIDLYPNTLDSTTKTKPALKPRNTRKKK